MDNDTTGNISTGTTITLEEEQWLYFMQTGIPVFIYMSLVCFVGVIGNFHAFVVYFFRFKPSNHRTFICCLSIVDFFACSFGVPLLLYDTRNSYTFDSVVLCKVYITFFFFASPYSLFLFNLVAVERYRKICKPLGNQVSMQQAFWACVIIGLCSSILIIPPAITYGPRQTFTKLHNISGSDCAVQPKYENSSVPRIFNAFILCIIIAALINCVVLYSLIGRALLQQERLIPRFKTENSREEKQDDFRTSIDLQEAKTFPRENVSCEYSVDYLDGDGIGEGFENGINETNDKNMEKQMTDLSWPSHLHSTTDYNSSSVVTNPILKSMRSVVQEEGQSTLRKQTSFANTEDITKEEKDPSHRNMIIRRRSRRKRNKIRRSLVITRMFLVSSVLSCAVYLPFQIFAILQVADDEIYEVIRELFGSSQIVIERLFLLNHVINPMVYCALDTRFRKQCKIMYHMLRTKIKDFFLYLTCKCKKT